MTTSRQRAQGHARHSSVCTCGKTVHGNGGKFAHARMHQRNGDGHYFMSLSDWEQRNQPPHPGRLSCTCHVPRRGVPEPPPGQHYADCPRSRVDAFDKLLPV